MEALENEDFGQIEWDDLPFITDIDIANELLVMALPILRRIGGKKGRMILQKWRGTP